MTRQYEAIDILKLYTSHTQIEWNDYLTKCHAERDIADLMKTRYRLQAGMDDLAKQKLNTDKVCLVYVRLLRSVEITANKIYREKYPMKNDDPALSRAENTMKDLMQKRNRDQEFEQFMRASAY